MGQCGLFAILLELQCTLYISDKCLICIQLVISPRKVFKRNIIKALAGDLNAIRHLSL